MVCFSVASPSSIVTCGLHAVGSTANMGGIRVTIIHTSRIPPVMYASRSSPASDLASSKSSTAENWGKKVLHNLHECQFFKICDTVEIQQLTISYR